MPNEPTPPPTEGKRGGPMFTKGQNNLMVAVFIAAEIGILGAYAWSVWQGEKRKRQVAAEYEKARQEILSSGLVQGTAPDGATIVGYPPPADNGQGPKLAPVPDPAGTPAKRATTRKATSEPGPAPTSSNAPGEPSA